MRLGLNLRVNLIVVPLVAAMLALVVGPILSFLSLRSALDDVRRELSCLLDLCRFDIQAVRQSVEYIDVAFMGEDPRELRQVTAGARATLDLLRGWELAPDEARALARIEGVYGRLTETGEKAIDRARRGEHEEAGLLFTKGIERIRDRELLPLVEGALIEGSLKLGDALDDLLASSAQLGLVPLVSVESDATDLRREAAGAVSAAKFAVQAQRLWGECRCLTFLGDPPAELAVAESEFDNAYRLWVAQVAARGTEQGAMTPAAIADVGARYRAVKRLSRRLVALEDGGARREVIRTYETDFEPLSAGSVPQVLESAFAAYDAEIAALLDSIAMRSRIAGTAVGAIAMLAVGLALGCPWLISRWVVQPVLALTRAARELGAGEGSRPVSVRTGGEIGELATTFNRMAQQLAERTEELENERARERLRHAERLASVGILASGLAHQINNPLNNILLSAEHALAEQGPDAPRMWREGLVGSAEEARRCERIVRGLVAFARGEPGPRWTEDANLLLQRARDLTTAEAAKREAAVELHPSERPVPILANSIALEQALVNIIQNAIESRPQARVGLRAERLAQTVRIEIRDDGRGMEAETTRRLFDPFYTTRSAEGGTGLGLSVAHRIITAHGGRIGVESRPGEGTLVTIDLPLDPSAAPSA